MSQSFNLTKTELREYMMHIFMLIVLPMCISFLEMLVVGETELSRKQAAIFLLSAIVNLWRMRATNYQSAYNLKNQEDMHKTITPQN